MKEDFDYETFDSFYVNGEKMKDRKIRELAHLSKTCLQAHYSGTG